MTEIGYYIESTTNPEGRFRTLKDITFSFDHRGNPDFVSGSNTIIFKGWLHGKKVAIKSYIKADPEREERYKFIAAHFKSSPCDCLTDFMYLKDELYIFDHQGNGSFRPVLLTEWTDGDSLGHWLAGKCQKQDTEAIARISTRFDRTACRLLEQEWAHGDLKPENIIVTPEEKLLLIDYDNLFVPSLRGRFSPELGTYEFQHPDRNKTDYDRHLDDYSIALISTALHALVEFPEWYTQQEGYEYLLFMPEKAIRGNCEKLNTIKEHWLNTGRTDLYELACKLHYPSLKIDGLENIIRRITRRPAAKSEERTNKPPEIYRENGFYGYQTLLGKKQTEAIYDDAKPFCDGLAAVRIGKKHFYISSDGKKQINASKYEQAESFSEGLAAVRQGKRWGYINLKGEKTITPRFEECLPFREGLAAVKSDGKWGFIDAAGKEVIQAVYDGAFSFREGTAVVQTGNRYGYITPKGNWLAEPRYTFASGFRNGTATVEINGKTISLAKSGNIITEIKG